MCGSEWHYPDVITSAMPSQIIGVLMVYSTVCSGADKKPTKAPRHWPLWGESTGDRLDSPHKGPVTQKMFPFNHVIMSLRDMSNMSQRTLFRVRSWNKCIQTVCIYCFFVAEDLSISFKIISELSISSTQCCVITRKYIQKLLIWTHWWIALWNIMMTSSNGNLFRVTGHLCGEFTGHWWIPRIKASDAELWCFLWSTPEYMVE